MKNIKEKENLIKMSLALGVEPDPKLVAEVAEYKALMSSVKSVGEEFGTLLSELGKLKSQSNKPKKEVQVPTPPTVEGILELFAEEEIKPVSTKEIPLPPTLEELMEEIGINEEDKVEIESKANNLIDLAAEHIKKEAQFEEKGFLAEQEAPLNQIVTELKNKIKYLEQWVSRIAATSPGSGEVNLLKLDDVDTRQIADNKYLKYNASNAKIEFATVSGGGDGSSITSANVIDGNLIITLSDASTLDAGYVIGPQGNTGATGANGQSSGLRFIYNSGSGFQDPGDGKFSVNRDSTPTFTSTTRLIFSYQSADAIAVNTLISRWDDNTTQTNRGVVMISKADGTQQSWWYITGAYAVAGNGFWNHTPATFLGGSTAFTNNEEYFVSFVRNGDKGDVGIAGANGISVTNAAVNESGNLIVTLSDSSNVDAGSVAADLSSYALTSDLTTANVVELTNLYYSNARVTANVVDYLLNAPNALIGNVVVVDTLTTPNFEVSETLTIGSQIIYAQGTNGFSVNEDFDPSNSSTQTAYHYTSGAGRETVAFTLARTGQFTNGFGIYGTAADNKFVMFGEQSNTGFEWRRGVGIRPLDLDGGTLLANISPTGDLTVTGNIRASGFIGNISGGVDLTNVSSNIVPSSDSVYNLGSPTNRWKTLYLANNTIDLGGSLIRSDGTGQISISGAGAILPSGSKIEVGPRQEKIALVGDTGVVINSVPFYTQQLGLNTAATNFDFGYNPDDYTFTRFTLSNGSSLERVGSAQFYF